jgi:hypothetical protein
MKCTAVGVALASLAKPSVKSDEPLSRIESANPPTRGHKMRPYPKKNINSQVKRIAISRTGPCSTKTLSFSS